MFLTLICGGALLSGLYMLMLEGVNKESYQRLCDYDFSHVENTDWGVPTVELFLISTNDIDNNMNEIVNLNMCTEHCPCNLEKGSKFWTDLTEAELKRWGRAPR